MKRRTFLRDAAAAAVGGLAPGGWRSASASPRASAPTAPTVTPLADRLLLIRGCGGNVTVFDSPEGVLLVDGGSPERSREALRLVRERTGRAQVAVLFNTHWHWEQTGSNRALGPAGSRIIAQENTRLWLGTEIDSKWQHRTYEPLPRRARPNQTFYTTGSLSFGGEQIDYGYLPQAHTDGDIYVFFRTADVLVAGDVVAVGSYPILDYSTDGWIGGMANATQRLLSLCGPSTRIVPGMGPIQSRADLEKEHAMLAATKLGLSHLLAQGLSAQEMLAAGATRAFDAEWGDPTLFVSNAYPGLVAHAHELGVLIV